MTDYYRFFGLERRLHLDPQDLERRFYQLSRNLHPDRYARKSPQERRAAENATAVLNDAYRTLKDPLARAEYLLRQEGVPDGRDSPQLLEEIFELNLELEELKSEGDPARLCNAKARFQALKSELDTNLATRFQEYDQSPSRESLLVIRETLNRRKYIANLEKDLAANTRS